ncbi:hypothetical protein [Roseimicrobium sp. ORNL1]|uniref:hypothetical protein n=1 Tax=Roseimicrobium sp. ORNL1 TaxID=2711231 RepID=UPI0013E1D7B0|nr:hypothetical protein [Roseimicrobium sp. ORNL1]QIF01708.1 hypothetical protein G5S37_09285 [Roseimicrobium sp. ORNL1]
MKVYRVVLSSVGAVHVEADRYEGDDSLVRFFRGDSVIAEYPASSVKEVGETGHPPAGGGGFFSAHAGED